MVLVLSSCSPWNIRTRTRMRAAPEIITWSIGVGRASKNRGSEAGSLASKAEVLCASIWSPACCECSGSRPVRMTLALRLGPAQESLTVLTASNSRTNS